MCLEASELWCSVVMNSDGFRWSASAVGDYLIFIVFYSHICKSKQSLNPLHEEMMVCLFCWCCQCWHQLNHKTVDSFMIIWSTHDPHVLLLQELKFIINSSLRLCEAGVQHASALPKWSSWLLWSQFKSGRISDHDYCDFRDWNVFIAVLLLFYSVWW